LLVGTGNFMFANRGRIVALAVLHTMSSTMSRFSTRPPSRHA
jgi:hypothetical protein